MLLNVLFVEVLSCGMWECLCGACVGGGTLKSSLADSLMM